MKYSLGDLVYQGETSGVHNWDTLSGTSFYWHPDWLHIAENMTGHTPAIPMEPSDNKPTKDDAAAAIVKHLNK
ncbi:hypothetical protein AB4238_07085 [Shewanella sp. 10N.286.45.A1]|uniref:hypothetical protein n=1 Tax=Shewanella sp. 10N.286.45.A1 TaxID=3229694 RepID=UPI0035515B74